MIHTWPHPWKKGKPNPKSHLSTQQLSHVPLCNFCSANLVLVLTSWLCNQRKQPHRTTSESFCTWIPISCRWREIPPQKTNERTAGKLRKLRFLCCPGFQSQDQQEQASCTKVGFLAPGSSSGRTSYAVREKFAEEKKKSGLTCSPNQERAARYLQALCPALLPPPNKETTCLNIYLKCAGIYKQALRSSCQMSSRWIWYSLQVQNSHINHTGHTGLQRAPAIAPAASWLQFNSPQFSCTLPETESWAKCWQTRGGTWGCKVLAPHQLKVWSNRGKTEKINLPPLFFLLLLVVILIAAL